MPYKIEGKCIYKKDTGKKVGCTKGDVHKYMAALHANANESENITESDKVEGGIADDLTAADIAKKFNVSISKIQAQIKMGKKVELEHTKNHQMAQDIAMDHLIEIPDYYTRLKTMEDEGLKYWKKKELTENLRHILRQKLQNL